MSNSRTNVNIILTLGFFSKLLYNICTIWLFAGYCGIIVAIIYPFICLIDGINDWSNILLVTMPYALSGVLQIMLFSFFRYLIVKFRWTYKRSFVFEDNTIAFGTILLISIALSFVMLSSYKNTVKLHENNEAFLKKIYNY